MLPSDMELRIKTGNVGYNNKILVSDDNFSLRKNDEVNSLETPAIKNHKSNSLETPAMKSHKTNSIEPMTITTSQGLTVTHTPAISQENQKPKTTITHNEEKIALVLALVGGFAIWNMFR